MRKILGELRHRTLWQVLIVYIGVSWVLLQAIDLFADNLDLPTWLFPTAGALLLVGLPIILVTAFIQRRLAATGEIADEAHEKLFTWRNATLGGAGAFLLLFGFAGLYVVIQDRGAAFAPPEAVAGEALPGIAVLPFSARGPDADTWREGVMDVLSTNIEGISGIRPISVGTTMARWAELAPESGPVDEATQLAIARATGARYFVSGSYVSSGEVTRLAGRVVDVKDGQSLGQINAEGPADDPFGLLDRFSVELIQLIGEKGDSELGAIDVDLQAVTTSDPEALRQYLRGLAFKRAYRNDEAAVHFDSAVARDSTFALALYRLALASEGSEPGPERVSMLRAAERHAPTDRLDLAIRSALAMNWAYGYDVEGMDLATYETVIGELETTLRRDPSDAELWHRLGELRFHEHNRNPAWEGHTSARDALKRAIELEPGDLYYSTHEYEIALFMHDRELYQEILSANERAQPGSEVLRNLRQVYRAVFDELPQPELMAVVDSLAASDEGIRWILGIVSALAPIRWPAVEAIAEAHLAESFGCVPAALEVGKLDWYLAFTLEHHPANPVACAFLPHNAWEIPVPGRLLDSLYEAQPEHPAASPYALSRGSLATYDSTNATQRAYKAWKVDGDLARAEQILRDNYGSTPNIVSLALALGSLRTELGDTEGAIAVLEAAAASYGYPGGFGGPRSLALYRLGPLYEQQGETEKARAAYAEFIERWIDADPELRPMVDTARAALARLGPMDQ
jgi:tetratricopeptide (TPR) repeat protein